MNFTKRKPSSGLSSALAIGAVLATGPLATADIVFQENFDGLTIGDDLTVSGWVQKASEAAVTVEDQGGGDLVARGTAGAYHTYSHALDTPVNSGFAWVTVDIVYNSSAKIQSTGLAQNGSANVPSGDNYYLGQHSHSDLNSGLTWFIRPGGDWGNSSDTGSTVENPAGTLVVGLDTDTGTAYFWNNPDGTDYFDPNVLGGNADGSLTNAKFDGTFNNFFFNSQGDVDYDNIIVATTSAEVGLATIPSDPDTDMDGLPDSWELQWDDIDFLSDLDGTLPAGGGTTPGGPNPGTGDFDGDGLSDFDEWNSGTDSTDPTDDDSDSDGLTDGAEVHGTLNSFPNPTTLPTNPDCDDDGINDGDEVNGTLNTANALAATDPNELDTDADGMDDLYEVTNNLLGGLDPNTDDADDNLDGDPGLDGDSPLSNYDEFSGTVLGVQTRADKLDTDGDDYPDHVEDNYGTWTSALLTGSDPTLADTDGDGLPDGMENLDLTAHNPPTQYDTDPNEPDTDFDDWDDLEEITRLTDPNDETSFPVVTHLYQDEIRVTEGDFNGIPLDEVLNSATIDGVSGWTTNGSLGYNGVATIGDLVFNNAPANDGCIRRWPAGSGSVSSTAIRAATNPVPVGDNALDMVFIGRFMNGPSGELTLTLLDGAATVIRLGSANDPAYVSGPTVTYTAINSPVQATHLFFQMRLNYQEVTGEGSLYITPTNDAGVPAGPEEMAGTFTATLGVQGIDGLMVTSKNSADLAMSIDVFTSIIGESVVNPGIISAEFNGPNFEVTAGSLDPTKTYMLMRGDDLLAFPDLRDTIANPSDTATFTDTDPPSGDAFYRIEVAAP